MRLSAIFLLVGALVFSGIAASAQNKFACVSFTELVRSMPETQKAEEAIRQVSKENGYAYVFEKDNLHCYPPGDDILPLVKKKLASSTTIR